MCIVSSLYHFFNVKPGCSIDNEAFACIRPVFMESQHESKAAPPKTVYHKLATPKAFYRIAMSINRAYAKKLEGSKFTWTGLLS